MKIIKKELIPLGKSRKALVRQLRLQVFSGNKRKTPVSCTFLTLGKNDGFLFSHLVSACVHILQAFGCPSNRGKGQVVIVAANTLIRIIQEAACISSLLQPVVPHYDGGRRALAWKSRMH